MEEPEFQTEGFFSRLKEFGRKKGIFIGVSSLGGTLMIVCALILGIFFVTYEAIELGPIFGISLVIGVLLFSFGAYYYIYGPIGRLMRKGERFQKKGKLGVAQDYYNRALILNPTSIRAIRSLVSVYRQMGSIEKAVELCKELISMSAPDNARFYHILGELYIQEKDYNNARKYVEKALELESDNYEYMLLLAGIHFKLKEYDSALNICNIIVNDQSKKKEKWIYYLLVRAAALDLIVQVYTKQNDRGKLLELSKRDSSVLGSLGLLHYEAGEYERAIEYYQRCLRHNKNNRAVWNNLGVGYMKIGQLDLAIKAFRKSIKIGKNQIKNFNFSLRVRSPDGTLFLMGNNGKLIELKESEITYNHLGFTYYKMGQFSKALKAAKFSLKLNSKFERAWYTLALIYFETERLNEALEACEKAIEIDQNYKEASELRDKILKTKN